MDTAQQVNITVLDSIQFDAKDRLSPNVSGKQDFQLLFLMTNVKMVHLSRKGVKKFHTNQLDFGRDLDGWGMLKLSKCLTQKLLMRYTIYKQKKTQKKMKMKVREKIDLSDFVRGIPSS